MKRRLLLLTLVILLTFTFLGCGKKKAKIDSGAEITNTENIASDEGKKDEEAKAEPAVEKEPGQSSADTKQPGALTANESKSNDTSNTKNQKSNASTTTQQSKPSTTQPAKPSQPTQQPKPTQPPTQPTKPSGLDTQLTAAYKSKYEDSPYNGEKSSFFRQKAIDVAVGRIGKEQAISSIKEIKPWEEYIPDIGGKCIVYITNVRINIQETTASDAQSIFREAYYNKLIMSTDYTDTEIYWDSAKKKYIVIRLGVTFQYKGV